MKKEEFIALGISDDLAAKAGAASLAELKDYIPSTEHATVKQAKEQLEKELEDRDKQLETLGKESKGNEEMTKQIKALQEDNKNAKAQYDVDMKEMKLSAAVKLAVAGEAQDMDIVSGLVDKTKLILADDGKVSGLDEQVKSLKESKPFLFKPASPGQSGGKPASGGYTPKAGATNEGSVAKAVAESMNKATTAPDNPYAKSWG